MGEIDGTSETAPHYRLEVDYGDAGTCTIEDPYAFAPTIGELDLHLIGEGRHEEIYEKLIKSSTKSFCVWQGRQTNKVTRASQNERSPFESAAEL